MAKILRMPDSPHVIQVKRGQKPWLTLPQLLYSSRRTALAGLDRLTRHAPHLSFRVRSWPDDSGKTLQKRAA